MLYMYMNVYNIIYAVYINAWCAMCQMGMFWVNHNREEVAVTFLGERAATKPKLHLEPMRHALPHATIVLAPVAPGRQLWGVQLPVLEHRLHPHGPRLPVHQLQAALQEIHRLPPEASFLGAGGGGSAADISFRTGGGGVAGPGSGLAMWAG